MSDLLAQCLTLLRQQSVEAYIVGGTVRDQLLGRKSHDIDLVVPRDALPVARILANQLGGAFYPLDAERETGRIVMPDRATIDIALMRGATIADDLAARDFTINAMARSVHDPDLTDLIDPHRGADDLRARVVRAVSPHSFTADPLRLLRAVRLAAELQFIIESATEKWMRQDAALVAQTSDERVRDEIARMLLTRDATQSLRALQAYGLLSLVLPNARQDDDTQTTISQFEQLLVALDVAGGIPSALQPVAQTYGALLREYGAMELTGERPRWLMLKLSLSYDTGESFMADLNALKFSRHEIEFARALLRHRERFAQLAPPIDALAAHRFFRDTGAAALGLIMLALGHALDTTRIAQTAAIAATLLNAYTNDYERVIKPSPLLSGAELADRFGLQGAHIGETLKALIEAQVSGVITTREDAERYLPSAIGDIR